MPILINDHVERRGDELALGGAGTRTWAQLAERVNRWIALLGAHGVGDGERIACVLGNQAEVFEVLLACLHAGITVVPVNWHLTEPEIAYILDDSASRLVVVAPDYAAVARAAADTRPVLVTGEVDAALSEMDPAEPARQTCGSIMPYTSGTTGVPKGVDNGLFETGAPFSRTDKMLAYARVVLGVQTGGRFLLDGPWYHSSQLFFALIALLRGARVVIRERFDPVATLCAIDRDEITVAHLVPTQFVRLLDLPDAYRGAFSGASLTRVWHGGGPCRVDVKQRMIDWWGPVLVEYYGATEGGAVTVIDSVDWLRHKGSVGRAVPPNEILVVGEDGSPVPAGRSGRVFVRRSTGRSFRYHNAPDKSADAHLEPGTFTFGDVGHLDEGGFLYLTGRAQDLIVSGGVNIYPAEVEAVLLTHPAVRDAAVIGVPDDEFGERVVGLVEAVAGTSPDPAELDRFCRRSLAGFKVPRVYHFVEHLPREATGKLRKDLLRDTYAGSAG